MPDVTLWIGGIGTQADATAIAGCVLTSTAQQGPASDFMGANGAPLATGATKSYVDNLDGTITLTDTGNLAAVFADLYIRILNATGAVEDWYLITASSINTVTFEDNGLSNGTFASNGTADYSIGGAGDVSSNVGGGAGNIDLQDQFDDIGSFAADGSNNVDILWNRDFY